jgi:hypothetical protein
MEAALGGMIVCMLSGFYPEMSDKTYKQSYLPGNKLMDEFNVTFK